LFDDDTRTRRIYRRRDFAMSNAAAGGARSRRPRRRSRHHVRWAPRNTALCCDSSQS